MCLFLYVVRLFICDYLFPYFHVLSSIWYPDGGQMYSSAFADVILLVWIASMPLIHRNRVIIRATYSLIEQWNTVFNSTTPIFSISMKHNEHACASRPNATLKNTLKTTSLYPSLFHDNPVSIMIIRLRKKGKRLRFILLFRYMIWGHSTLKAK